MQNRLFIFTLVIILLISLSGTISNADSSVPKGLKNHYNYNTEDRSIMPVKNRLYELGYCDEIDISSAWINNRLKTAVTNFQINNELEANGSIDKTLHCKNRLQLTICTRKPVILFQPEKAPF